MPVSELLPRLQELPRRDKLMLVQYLVSELAREEGIEPLESSASYAVWTPLDAYGAADSLAKLLAEDNRDLADN